MRGAPWRRSEALVCSAAFGVDRTEREPESAGDCGRSGDFGCLVLGLLPSITAAALGWSGPYRPLPKGSFLSFLLSVAISPILFYNTCQFSQPSSPDCFRPSYSLPPGNAHTHSPRHIRAPQGLFYLSARHTGRESTWHRAYR